MTMRGKNSLAAVLGAACLVALAGCGEGKHGKEAPVKHEAPAAVGVRVAPVVAEELDLTRELSGSVQSSAVSQVSARIMAQVLTVPVNEGDRVAKGAVLATLDDRELQAKVRQAESALRQAEAGRSQAATQLELATATLARYQALLDGRAVSRQEFDNVAAQQAMARSAVAQAESAVAQAQSGVEEAKTWLAFAVITSPVSGRITAKRVDPGSMAAPGQPLLVVEQEGRHRVELPVDGTLSGTITKGAPLSVFVEAAGLQVTVPVTEVVPSADPVSRTFIVRADLPANPRLSAGQYARVSVALGKRTALAVPESALVRRGQLDGVFVDAGGVLAFRIVQVGRAARPGSVEILSGLAAGERVVVEGAERAVDGARVAEGGR
jgi:RND family efflux transporter MFP subunit